MFYLVTWRSARPVEVFPGPGSLSATPPAFGLLPPVDVPSMLTDGYDLHCDIYGRILNSFEIPQA